MLSRFLIALGALIDRLGIRFGTQDRFLHMATPPVLHIVRELVSQAVQQAQREGLLQLETTPEIQVERPAKAENGDFANWRIPSRKGGGIGGAMDLAVGAKRVFIAMEHVTRDGQPKLLKKCTLPITAPGVVKLVATDLGLFEITPQGFKLVEHAPGWSPEDIQELTEGKLVISNDLREFRFRD